MKINSVGIMCGFHSDVGSRSRIIMLCLLVFNFQKRRPLGGSSQSVNREKCTRNLVNDSPRVTHRLSKAFPPVFTSKFIFKKTYIQEAVCLFFFNFKLGRRPNCCSLYKRSSQFPTGITWQRSINVKIIFDDYLEK